MKSNIFKNIFRMFSAVILINLIFVMHAIAFEGVTHKAINSYIADETSAIYGTYLHTYLKNNLGMEDGVKTIFNSKMAKDWIGEGGVYEDDFFRYLNHFHNPITDQGLLGHYSALTWAIGEGYRSGYSWYDVRDNYYRALVSTRKADRDYFFVQTFRGLGQVMHMVQDMSVPAHIRGDKHPSLFGIGGDPYENWVMAGKELLMGEHYCPEVKA